MSLINKMLQDLDARGNPRGGELPADIHPVAPGARRLPAARIAAITAAVIVLALGATAWYVLPIKGKTFDVQPVPPVAQVTPPPAAPVPAPAATPAPVAETAAEAAPAPDSVAEAEAEPKTPAEPVAQAPARKRRAAAQSAPPAARTERTSDAGAAQGETGRIERSGGSAETAYRRALAHLQEGRVSEAIAGLQGLLRVYPNHEAARQTLVGLLVEARREDEAMVQLQQALALNERQPAMAMLLARLQIERGKSGIETLLRTLPYAGGNGDYHAFLGGAYQRQGRYREAAEQYTDALRTAPDNAVWWMGLGLALQDDKRLPEAADALRQAKALGTLPPELQSHVERKLAQVTR